MPTIDIAVFINRSIILQNISTGFSVWERSNKMYFHINYRSHEFAWQIKTGTVIRMKSLTIFLINYEYSRLKAGHTFHNTVVIHAKQIGKFNRFNVSVWFLYLSLYFFPLHFRLFNFMSRNNRVIKETYAKNGESAYHDQFFPLLFLRINVQIILRIGLLDGLWPIRSCNYPSKCPR